MRLTGPQHRQLTDALIGAFPTSEGLQRMVRYNLDANLDAVVGGSTLTDRCFALVVWAEAQGQVERLVEAAVAENPLNPGLVEFKNQYLGVRTPENASLQDLEAAVRVIRWADPRGKLGELIAAAWENADSAVISRLASLFATDPGATSPPTEELLRAVEENERRPALQTADLQQVRGNLLELAATYDQIREEHPAGWKRTGMMGDVAARMRTLATDAVPLVPDLCPSASAGERLAAISILEERPQAERLQWLSERLRMELEQPFVGYHAAIALRNAARELGAEHLEAVSAAIEGAKAALGPELKSSDRARMLDQAAAALRERGASGPDGKG